MRSTPPEGAERPWTRATSRMMSARRDSNHRGHDLLVTVGQPQWLIGKFAYGPTDVDLVGEQVDVFVERGCSGTWEQLGTATTTHTGEHATVDGVRDDGGRVYFPIPDDKALDVGRHRARFVVAGDRTYADLFIDVVRPSAPIFVSDIDGTLTSSEGAEVGALFLRTQPHARPGAATALSTLAAKGYSPVYLTARPEWAIARTRAFLASNHFPPGILRTTSGLMPHQGKAAAAFKAGELERLRAQGISVVWAFGNQPSDADAYDVASVEPRSHRVFVGCPTPGRRARAHGGRSRSCRSPTRRSPAGSSAGNSGGCCANPRPS
jgi:phosphatidate phosphatase PAH1